MPDLRRLLRASPPGGKSGRVIQVHLTPDDYGRLYNMAFNSGRSLADQVRALIRGADTAGGNDA